jgi:acylphosphatase
MRQHWNIRVQGRVQGVFYRASARQAAVQCGISGFVRNEDDGSVYIEAEGEPADLDRFAAWCRRGPPHALVTNVAVQPADMEDYRSFEVTP